MKLFLVFTIAIIGLIACHTPSLPDSGYVTLNDDVQKKWAIRELGLLADSTFTDSSDLNSILAFKAIDKQGVITTIEMDRAIQLYIENKIQTDAELHSIFEIKQSSHVILLLSGDGLWDKISASLLIDKKSLKIVNIAFEHVGETPGLGGQINESAFESQFIGTTINLESNSFSLYQEAVKIINGKHKIDGITGATITSKGVIEMLNEGLAKYKVYLQSS